MKMLKQLSALIVLSTMLAACDTKLFSPPQATTPAVSPPPPPHTTSRRSSSTNQPGGSGELSGPALGGTSGAARTAPAGRPDSSNVAR